MVRKRVAVMQPYFFPYAGYFRLFAAVDEFVIFDCVQFPRRGRVHRCEVPRSGAGREWLTLPLARQPRDVLIRSLSLLRARARRLIGVSPASSGSRPQQGRPLTDSARTSTAHSTRRSTSSRTACDWL